MLFLAVLSFFSTLTKADEPTYGTIEGIGALNEFKTSAFINEHNIPISNYTTTGDLPNYPFSNALGDSPDNRYWIGAIETTETDKNVVELEFDDLQIVGSILYYVAYRTISSIRYFDGFPTILNIYSKVDDTYPYELKYTVNNQPYYPPSFDSAIIPFPRRIICRKLKLEFVEVTPLTSFNLPNNRYAAIRELFIFKNTTENPYFPAQKATGSFSSPSNAIGKSECTTLTAGDQANHGKDLVFASGTFWAGSVPNNLTFKNYFIFELKEMTSIESIDYGLAYSTSKMAPWTRRYDGYPIVLNIYEYIACKYELTYIYYGLPLTNAGDNKGDLWDAIHIQFPKPIWCTRIKLEFEELTIDYSFGSQLTPSAQYIFLRKTPPDQIKPPDRIDEENCEDTIHNITISRVNFTDFSNTHEFGGAIYVINYQSNIIDTNFTNCTSIIAGGAIYISTQLLSSEGNLLEGLEFNNCESGYGGAVCIIAKFENDFTSIVDCIFNSNVARNNGPGSAIYLAATSDEVKACKFTKNTGSSIIKYAASEPASSSRILTSSNLVISDCSFEDDIKEGSFYIEVDETLDSKGISLKDNKFKSNDTQQAIKINQSPVKQETKSKSSLLLTILVPTLCVISLLLIIFIIVVHKNKDQQSEQEANHNEELTQDEV